MATDIIARGMITEYIAGTNINFTENRDGTVEISASGSISSEDSAARDAINNHKSDTSNPHNVTAEQIGLNNVDNTADLDKPISTAVQTALNDKANTKHTHKKSDITDFPNSLPANGGNADTVNGHTVEADVPADAVFTDTTYEAATQTEDGLMSAEDKTKLDGIEEGANKTVVDTALSGTSTNPVQNKVINAALNGKAASSHTHDDRYYTEAEIDAMLDEKAGKDVATQSADGLMSAEDKVKLDEADNTYASKALYGDTTINIGRKAGTTVGGYSTAEGYKTTASGNYSHAEGSNATSNGGVYGDRTVTISDVDYNISGCAAYGINSHAEGTQTFAYGYTSHAEGYSTTASGYVSHAEGSDAIASGARSHAEGSSTTASGARSHAEGSSTTASNYSSHASGHHNAAMTDGGDSNNTTGTAFVIGNGTSKKALSNAFSVQFSGVVKAKSTITASTTADYAEFFEWLDGNPDDEDRIGYFVTIDGDKIRIATAADDYILGVVSGEPFVLGNGDCDTWNGMFLRDEFRRTIFEPAPKMAEILDSEGNPTGEFEEVEGEFEGTRPKLNPEYDHTQKYISRFDRKEWAPVGMLGVLAVRHDGTAVVNGYVTVNADGIATACEKSSENAYRVIKSNTDSVVEIIFR